ncbi:hypothetical protein ABBQ32_008579 [Trebouxia sp. C0010 RCD-2024]
MVGALEYRCQGLHQDKQQLTQQLQQLKGKWTILLVKLCQLKLEVYRHLATLALEAEGLATKAREEQYRAEQDLASAGLGQHVLPTETQATIPQPAGTGGLQSTANDLQTKLACAELACASLNVELTAANQRVQQLEQSNHMQVPMFDRQQQGDAGQTDPDRASDIISEKMKGQMTGLKASRDKLLAEVDRQSREIERLLYHNAALEQGMGQMKQSAARWEAEAQDSLLQLDQVKGLLEESAFWQPQAQTSSTSGNPLGHTDESTPSETELQQSVLQEKARATKLEVQVRALSLELTKSREHAGALSLSLAPALGGIESKLAQLLQGGLRLSTQSNDTSNSN